MVRMVRPVISNFLHMSKYGLFIDLLFPSVVVKKIESPKRAYVYKPNVGNTEQHHNCNYLSDMRLFQRAIDLECTFLGEILLDRVTMKIYTC